jgi:hypothetical protein
MPKIELLNSTLLTDFPSGSSINYYRKKIYLIGDDATSILILDKDYQQIDSLQLFNYSGKRIPKADKVDLEASAFITIHQQEYFLLVGSASKPQREKVFLIPFTETGLDMKSLRIYDDDKFTDRMKRKGIEEVNMEGITIINDYLILTNRGNRKNQANHFLVTEVGFWREDRKVNLNIIPVQINASYDVPSISEICYVETFDILLVTLSTEASDNAYDDGAIGNSYIGFINNISSKLNNNDLTIDTLINLSEVHADFKNEKIEGVCVESIHDNTLIVHFVSDNDNGESKLFKAKLMLV